MKIEAVVICVNYADFLAESLPTNKHQFDRLVVVTTPEDKATQKLCEYYHVQCIQTDVFDTANGNFRKGAAINVGLAALDRDAWLCHMDADIVLPPKFRIVLERAHLATDNIYGVDRFMIVGAPEWDAHRGSPIIQHQHWSMDDDHGYFIITTAYKYGVRIGAPDGWVPIGYFQLWHSSQRKDYPNGHTTAGREDMLMGMSWPRHRRILLPDSLVYHLESEKSPMGSNWCGRTTAPFRTPPTPMPPPTVWGSIKSFWKSLP